MPRHSDTTFFQRLYAFDEFFEPVHREIVEWLAPAHGGRIADIGCGAAGSARLFADAVGAGGAIAAVETGFERVHELRALLELPSAHDRKPAPLSLCAGKLPALPFENDSFDLTWSSRVIHHLADPVEGIRELARITKPGGRVVLREGGVAPRFLPHDVGIGAPGIEARLHMAQSEWFDHMHAHSEQGARYPHGWLTALREGGLRNVTARSFLYELIPPLSAAQRDYLYTWLSDVATNEEYPLSDTDRTALAQLCDPASPHYAFERDDLHFLYVASIYVGQK